MALSSGFSATISSQPSRLEQDSVAPAGPGRTPESAPSGRWSAGMPCSPVWQAIPLRVGHRKGVQVPEPARDPLVALAGLGRKEDRARCAAAMDLPATRVRANARRADAATAPRCTARSAPRRAFADEIAKPRKPNRRRHATGASTATLSTPPSSSSGSGSRCAVRADACTGATDVESRFAAVADDRRSVERGCSMPLAHAGQAAT